MQTFATELAHRRKQLGLTQSELGEKIGKTKQSISHWESGRVEPSMADLTELSKALECTLDELIVGIKNEDKKSISDSERKYYLKMIDELSGQVQFLSKQLVGKYKAYLMTQRVYVDTLLGTPGLN